MKFSVGLRAFWWFGRSSQRSWRVSGSLGRRFGVPKLDFRGRNGCFFDVLTCARTGEANMLRSCFGPIKTVVSCTSELLRDKTRRAQHRTKIALQAFRRAFSQRSCEKLVPSALQDAPRAPKRLQERAKIAQERAKIAQERANIAQERAKIAQNRANIAQARATIASRSRQERFLAIFVDFGLSWLVPEASQRRFWLDFRGVCSFVRACFCCCVWSFVRSFVQSFARAFVRLSSPRLFDFELRVLVRSHTRSFARSFVHVRSFACLLVRSLIRFLTSPKQVDTTARQHELTKQRRQHYS